MKELGEILPVAIQQQLAKELPVSLIRQFGKIIDRYLQDEECSCADTIDQVFYRDYGSYSDRPFSMCLRCQASYVMAGAPTYLGFQEKCRILSPESESNSTDVNQLR